jgi:Zn finger protein HypA/HybF involved in hydrogenase expression
MHELTLARDICRITAEHVGDERLADIVEVGIEVGEDAGVEVRSLEFCLEALLSAPPFGRARPAIEVRAGAVLCVAYLRVDDGDPEN